VAFDPTDHYLGTRVDGVHLKTEQLFVGSQNLNDLLGGTTYTGALFHILRGRMPTDGELDLFDLVLVAFHGGFGLLPPTTLVPRLVAGTGVSTAQALAAGYLASGPYHVGAVEQAMTLYGDVLRDFRDRPTNEPRTAGALATFAGDHVERMIAAGETVPGYGHPLLRNDPRPARIRRLLCEREVDGPYLDVYDGIVERVKSLKGVVPNVDGITGAVLLLLGFLPQHGTGLFLLARTAAMLAHVVEEQTKMPYQTQRRFMFTPVMLPWLFSADFDKLTRTFNKTRDNQSMKRLGRLFGGGKLARQFEEAAERDQAVAAARREQRESTPIDAELAALPSERPPVDEFVVASTRLPNDPGQFADAPTDVDLEEAFGEVEQPPEYLAAAAYWLSTSLADGPTAGENRADRAAALLEHAAALLRGSAGASTGGPNVPR
jgi:hypothetical protein